ncbi:MAG: CTP synthase (glutamine hydrolyzing) [Candidatus Aenigmarchaeota archaeon]|nr:CTP synthase (glutamine hydrolyzing) [Candidatus Aenigmarchaeota archaeon]
MSNYIFITGGVISGLGKGITTASIGKVLQLKGYTATAIKIDPYINMDAGTLRPTEHGEVWVTEDGGEIDQDLGHYERFLDTNISKEHNITTGQIYYTVIEKERKGEYLGKTVQPIPHITDEIKKRIKNVAKKTKADFVLVEIGGVVGDYENVLFLEAARQMKFEGENVIFIHVVYLPVVKSLGEMKSKPAQHSIKELREIGIQPDFLVCRSEEPVDDVRKEKLSLFCSIQKEYIISNPNLENVYELPLVFEKQNFGEKILNKFGLKAKASGISEWRKFVEKMNSAKKIVKIGIVGKYFDVGLYRLPDSYISVIEAIKHAAANNNAKPKIEWIDSKEFEKDRKKLSILDSLDGVIVPGGFGKTGIEGKILAIKYAREKNIPFLGLCLGLQLAVIEFARNVCNLKNANSTEFDPKTPYPVVDILPEQKEILKESRYGASMRLGAYQAILKKGSLVWKLYGKKEKISERHRHRYEVNPNFHEILQKNGLVFSGISPDGRLVEFIELPNHKYFVATQAHPEFKSRPLKPAPLFDGLIKACL